MTPGLKGLPPAALQADFLLPWYEEIGNPPAPQPLRRGGLQNLEQNRLFTRCPGGGIEPPTRDFQSGHHVPRGRDFTSFFRGPAHASSTSVRSASERRANLPN